MIRIISSFGFALSGIASCLAKEANFKIHIAAGLFVTAAGIFFKIALTEWMLIILSMGFVISMEMVNTAVEQLCNFVHIGRSPVIKIVKDVAAGAVLVSALSAFLCGAIIFLPKIFAL